MTADAVNWKTIDTVKAQTAINNGATVFPLGVNSFYSGGSIYTHGLQTKRGTYYRLSKQVFRGLVIPQEGTISV